MRDEVDDTDMTAEQFRAARDRGISTQVVTSRGEFEARSPEGVGRFEIYQDQKGLFRFRLMASNGEVLATSEAFRTKSAAKKSADKVRFAANTASVVEVAS
ncbi:MAG: YegP family protein [Pseudonocardiaceae bacterium]